MDDLPPPKPTFPSWGEVLGINRRQVILAVILMVVGAVGIWQGPKRYQRWKTDRLERRAAELLAKGQLQEAALTAYEILRHEPANLPATRIMASLAVQQATPSEVAQWYRRLAQLEPGQPEHRFAWAAMALRAGELVSANEALAGMSPGARQTATYHELAGSLALSVRQLNRARLHFLHLPLARKTVVGF